MRKCGFIKVYKSKFVIIRMFENVNYIGVFVATIASFVLGFLWYGPLFGKTWMNLMNFTPKSMKSMKLKPANAMILSFISTLVMVIVIGYFINILNISTVSNALIFGFIIWIGFIGTTTLGSFLWENKSFNLYLLNNLYNLINIEIIISILFLLS